MEKKVRLNNGYELPAVCLGTPISPTFYQDSNFIKKMYHKNNFLLNSIIKHDNSWFNAKNSEKVFLNAMKYDCCFFDTSRAYGGSESLLKLVLQKYERKNYYICTKLCNRDQLNGVPAEQALQDSMDKLGVDYVDLYLIHWPVTETWIGYWHQLEKLYEKGLCKAIGVSNCKIHHLEKLKVNANIIPMVNQVELHPLLTEEELCNYCVEKGIQVMAYSSTARSDSRLKQSKVLREISEKYEKNINQIILRWHIQKKVIPIFNTKSVTHLKDNMNIFDFKLSYEDMKKISSLNINSRIRYDSDTCDFSKL